MLIVCVLCGAFVRRGGYAPLSRDMRGLPSSKSVISVGSVYWYCRHQGEAAPRLTRYHRSLTLGMSGRTNTRVFALPNFALQCYDL